VPTGTRKFRSGAFALPLALTLGALLSSAAHALSIELKDVAADRIERQRAYAGGRVPLPGTPDTSRLEQRLAEKGLKKGRPILIRIFKAQSELELWMEKEGTYELFATYPICNWSGTLGPKLREGDKQTPEGFYTITSRQLHRLGRWRHALNLGFPNAFDESLKRDGSYILVHGGCSSVGCFAMTDAVVLEIFQLTSAALRGGQYHVPVHVFPFRMTRENMTAGQDGSWKEFWANLKEGYDSFERTRRPPRISVCNGLYHVDDASPAEAGTPLPLAVCGATAAAIRASDASAWLVQLPSRRLAPTERDTSPERGPDHPDEAQPQARASLERTPEPQKPPREEALRPSQIHSAAAILPGRHAPRLLPNPAADPEQGPPKAAEKIDPDREYELIPQLSAERTGKADQAVEELKCDLRRASCRRFAALERGRAQRAGKEMPARFARVASKDR